MRILAWFHQHASYFHAQSKSFLANFWQSFIAKFSVVLLINYESLSDVLEIAAKTIKFSEIDFDIDFSLSESL